MRPLVLAALAVGTAAAWLLLPQLHDAARLWTVVLLVPLPALMIAEGQRLQQLESLPRTQAYISSIISLWTLAFATLAVTAFAGIELRAIGLAPADAAATVAYAAGATLAAVAILFLFRWAGVREPDVVRQLMPVTRQDRALFIGVSITAGICEEIIYRGFLLYALMQALPLPIAVVLASGAFGVAHAYQQPLGALRAALLGAVLTVPVLATGSLVPAMLAHASIDVLSGLWLSRYLLR
jgi:membrane protease YdiL (CAAX protease family)